MLINDKVSFYAGALKHPELEWRETSRRKSASISLDLRIDDGGDTGSELVVGSPVAEKRETRTRDSTSLSVEGRSPGVRGAEPTAAS